MAPAERQIIHLEMDAFYTSIEIRDNPWLRGQPVIVGGMSSRGIVCAASHAAREAGVQPGMPMKNARRVCPNGVFLKTRINHYKEVSRQIQRLLEEYTDMVEPVTLDEWYLDVTQNKKGIESGLEIARALKQQILERLELTASGGVAPCKFVARIASDMKKPDGLVAVGESEVRDFLAPLSVAKIPGVGEVHRRQLAAMGAHTIAQLAAIPLSDLEQTFGKFGQRLREYAHGIDTRSVMPERENKRLSREETFDSDTSDMRLIRETLERQAEALALRLEAKGVTARTIRLRVRYGDFTNITRDVTHDNYFRSAAILLDQAFELLKKTEVGTRPIRMIGLAVANFWQDDEAEQLTLFEMDEEEKEEV
ncbi:MAG: DNA polymerase IV [Candidatus Sumerlaeota bacterium]|nr:DNA polymerase IV [Candidatus Sumerlaeota bacterium]